MLVLRRFSWRESCENRVELGFALTTPFSESAYVGKSLLAYKYLQQLTDL